MRWEKDFFSFDSGCQASVSPKLIEFYFRENTFLTGSMERPRRMEVWSSAENKLSMVAKLSGDEMASVASLVDIHHSGAVVGANSSGRLHLFA